VHELSIMEGVLDVVRSNARERNIGKVSKLKLVIGKLTMIMPDSLRFSFEVLSQNELFQGALLEIEEKDIVITCNKCSQSSILEDAFSFLCPACGVADVDIVSGREMLIEYYEGDSC
jgi:hydrogenase nickel incorporation protein HypA/HybF